MIVKVLILGANSFVARSIINLFDKNCYYIDSCTKEELDLRNLEQLKFKLKNKFYDYVINCAISGQGRLLKKDNFQNFYENILMHENILACKKLYGQLIDFSSGAEFDRTKNISNIREYSLQDPSSDCYSLAKRVNSYRSTSECNVLNLRIFNVFGELERTDRFIKTTILNCIQNKNVSIWGDSYFDFFYVEDLFRLINHLILNKEFRFTEINCVYKKKYRFSEITNIIKKITNSNSRIIIDGNINRDYTGNGSLLDSLDIDFYGLEEGIRRTYLWLMQEKK